MMPSSKLGRAWLTAQQLSSASLSHQMHFQEISYLLIVTKAFEYIQDGCLHSGRDGWCTGGSRDTNRKERETGLPAHLGEELGLLTSVARQTQVKAKWRDYVRWLQPSNTVLAWAQCYHQPRSLPVPTDLCIFFESMSQHIIAWHRSTSCISSIWEWPGLHMGLIQTSWHKEWREGLGK